MTAVRGFRVGDLVADLPDLERAACRGRQPLHDLDVAGETLAERAVRHQAAARLCRACPELDRCAAVLGALPRGTAGVWAGYALDGRRPPRQISGDGEGTP